MLLYTLDVLTPRVPEGHVAVFSVCKTSGPSLMEPLALPFAAQC
jgi:hypothetical protein